MSDSIGGTPIRELASGSDDVGSKTLVVVSTGIKNKDRFCFAMARTLDESYSSGYLPQSIGAASGTVSGLEANVRFNVNNDEWDVLVRNDDDTSVSFDWRLFEVESF